MTIAILIIGRQEKGTMEFSVWFHSRLLNSKLNFFQEIGGFQSTSVKFYALSRFYQIMGGNHSGVATILMSCHPIIQGHAQP